MTYRDPYAEGQRRSEAEIAAREALAPLAAEGRARREGRAGTELVRVTRRPVELLPVREIDRELELLPVRTVIAVSRALSPQSSADLAKVAGGMVLALLGVLLAAASSPAAAAIIVPLAVGIAGALATSSSVFRLHREVSWVRSLPFPVRGYYDSFVRDGASELLVEVAMELPSADLELVLDLVERARGEVPVAVERVADGLRIVATAPPRSLLAAFRRALLDEVLVPLHALHPIARVKLRWLRPPSSALGWPATVR